MNTVCYSSAVVFVVTLFADERENNSKLMNTCVIFLELQQCWVVCVELECNIISSSQLYCFVSVFDYCGNVVCCLRFVQFGASAVARFWFLIHLFQVLSFCDEVRSLAHLLFYRWLSSAA